MKLFGNKKSEKPKGTKPARKKPEAVKSETKPASGSTLAPATSSVLVRPHITEKAAQLTAKDVYTFEVAPDATKTQIAAAVHALYKVTPRKIAIAKNAGKRVSLRTRRGWGMKGGVKKAYVYLTKGDRIEFS